MNSKAYATLGFTSLDLILFVFTGRELLFHHDVSANEAISRFSSFIQSFLTEIHAPFMRVYSK